MTDPSLPCWNSRVGMYLHRTATSISSFSCLVLSEGDGCWKHLEGIEGLSDHPVACEKRSTTVWHVLPQHPLPRKFCSSVSLPECHTSAPASSYHSSSSLRFHSKPGTILHLSPSHVCATCQMLWGGSKKKDIFLVGLEALKGG